MESALLKEPDPGTIFEKTAGRLSNLISELPEIPATALPYLSAAVSDISRIPLSESIPISLRGILYSHIESSSLLTLVKSNVSEDPKGSG